ncbi:MAG: hypothetical protein OXD50_13065 [Chloroflexi bacterium]|nr:hypothetical protein [Chloroflexota bacterium]
MSTLNVASRTLFHGDNLLFLRGINSGIIQLIATYPPFNKSRDFRARPGSLAAGAKFDDSFNVGLGHSTPRLDGGMNQISSQLLLCGPCNRINSNGLTLSGLRAENQRLGQVTV